MSAKQERTGLGEVNVSIPFQASKFAQPTPGFWSLSRLPLITKISRLLFATVILSGLVTSGISFINAYTWLDRPFTGFMLNARMIVQDTGLPYWTGVQARLNYPDRVLSANGIKLASRKDLDKVVKASRLGDPMVYEFERDGKISTIAIRTMTFSRFDFTLIYLIPFVSGLIYLLLGFVVFIMKPDTKVSWAFLSVCLFLSLHITTSFGVVSGQVGLLRLQILASGLLPAALFHLALVFPTKRARIERQPAFLLVLYIISLVLVVPYEWLYPVPAFLIFLQLLRVYLILGVLALLGSILEAFFKDFSALARQRAKTVLWGAALAFPLPALVVSLPVLGMAFKDLAIQDNFLPLPLILFPAAIAYAISKHNLFDVDVYIKRTVGYVLMTGIVAMAYFSMQALISTVVLGPILGENAQKVYPILFALLVVFLFNPVNRRVQDAVDRMFFRKKFDYRETVASVSNALTSLLDLGEIIKQVIHTVRREMFIDTAGVILVESQKKGCQAFFVGDEKSKEVCIPYDDPLLALLSKEKKLITKYDIAEDPRYAAVKEPCGQRFSEMGASLAIPLIYRDEVNGFLALGYKKSGHFYTREDIDLLTTLADQGAVAIENARLVEQMRKEETVRTNLARYLSPQIVDQIIQKDVKVNLGGGRKVVTVLFSDIRNFTTITETRPPDQLVQILNEYFTEMAGIIFENQGSLDKYIGDAIVAVFGSLIPLENTASHAVTAAIQMMRRLPVLNEKWLKEYGFTMAIGIGINTGEVFLGNIGSPERMEFTVIGDTVNVASRFSGLAKPGQILMTRETFTCLGPDILYKELPPSEVKGKTGKLEVFEITYA